MGKRGPRLAVRIGDEHPRLHEHLEAVADPEHETTAVAEAGEEIAEPGLQFEGEDPSAGDVVAVGEAAGDAEDLVVVGKRRLLCQGVDMNPLGNRPGPLEGVDGLMIAVRAGGTEDENTGGEHAGIPGDGAIGNGSNR